MRVSSRPGTTILWLLVGIIVILSGASTVLSLRHAEQSNDRVTRQALERTITTAAAVDEYLSQRIGALQALATAPVFVEGTPEEQDAYFARVDLGAIGFGGGFGLVGLDGTMTAYANAAGPDASVDVTGRSYYRAVAASGEPFVSEAVLSNPSRLLVVPIAVPVKSPEGTMTGILVGALRLDAAGEAPLLRILSPETTVVDRDGQVIVERGAIAQLRSVEGDATYRTLATGRPGVDEDAVDLTGEQNQLVSSAPVGEGGWLVVADEPRRAAFGAARQQLLQELAIKGLLSVLALCGALLAARHLDRAAASAERSAALSAAQSRVLERIALRHPLHDVLEDIRTEFAALRPGDQRQGDDAGTAAVAAHLEEIAVEQDRSAGEVVLSERRYRALVEANSAAVWRYVPGRAHSETSPWWGAFTGQTPEEMDGRGWLDAVHPDDRDRIADVWSTATAGGEPFADSFRVRRAEGAYRQLDMRGVPVPSPDGQTLEWIGTYVDVTEERAQGEALRISEERQRLALDAADLGAWDWDLLTGEVQWSPVVERHVGLAPGTFEGTIEAVRSFIHPDDREALTARARIALERGEPFSAEYRLIRTDGAVRWTRATGVVIHDRAGRAVRLLGIDVDTTEEKERHTERQLFLASVAHDLKNPIAVLKASAQLLQRRAARGSPIDAEEARVRLAVIESNATRLARRLDDLSDLSLLEAGFGVDLAPSPVDLVALATGCVESARRVSVAHNLRVESDHAEIVGSWDATRIERVLDNLISNATKYSPDGGDVTVRIWSDPVNAYVSVADQGIGVPPDERTSVFEFRRRGSNVGAIMGTGVGLAGASRLVELAGGELSVASNDGAGATFLVRLPLAPPGDRR